jgi:Protein of unknown function (DUF3631)
MIGVIETGWLLEKVIPQIRRFVVMSDDQALAVGLWAMHTWAVEAADCAPYLDVSSPTRECGKTRLFEALELVVRKPRRCTGHTEATLFRMIESEHPTLLLDEIDTTFGKDPKLYAGIRGVLDEGHRRGGSVPRMVGEGKNMTMKFFDVFGPKAFAGIGTLPETIASRSIPIRLERKSRGEKVARLRYSRERAASGELREALAEWASAAAEVLSAAEPAFPEELSDRQWDLWEPLFAIADLTGSSSEARKAAVALHAGAYNDTSAGLLALEHSRAMFNGHEAMSTKSILEEFVAREDGPWAPWWGHDVEAGHYRGPAARLARLLRPFGIEPKQLWIDGRNERGYESASFAGAWERYLVPLPPANDARTLGASPDMASDQATSVLATPAG